MKFDETYKFDWDSVYFFLPNSFQDEIVNETKISNPNKVIDRVIDDHYYLAFVYKNELVHSELVPTSMMTIFFDSNPLKI